MALCAVVAAAGLSARMRDFKPLLCLGSSTIIRHTVEGLQAAGAEHIVVVTGYQSSVLERHLQHAGVMFVKNERYAVSDMLTSIRLGLKALGTEAERVFVTPADVPLVAQSTLKAMLAENVQVVRPVYEGRGGHPLLLRSDAVEKILSWHGEGGLKGLLSTGELEVKRVETGDPGILMDADTPQDYRRLLQYQTRLSGRGSLRMELQVKIGMDEMVFTRENAQLLDMIAQTGSIQNACACMHISYSKGWKAVRSMEEQLGFPLVRRIAGGADGGGSSLTEKGEDLLKRYQEFQEEVVQQARLLFEKHFPADVICMGEQKQGGQ